MFYISVNFSATLISSKRKINPSVEFCGRYNEPGSTYCFFYQLQPLILQGKQYRSVLSFDSNRSLTLFCKSRTKQKSYSLSSAEAVNQTSLPSTEPNLRQFDALHIIIEKLTAVPFFIWLFTWHFFMQQGTRRFYIKRNRTGHVF